MCILCICIGGRAFADGGDTPTSSPVPAATSSPASAPAIAPASKPSEATIDPRSIFLTMPLTPLDPADDAGAWYLMTAEQKAPIRQRYLDALAKWEKLASPPRGQKVRWRATFLRGTAGKYSDVWVQWGKGYVIRALGSLPSQPQAGEEVEIEGVIRDWRLLRPGPDGKQDFCVELGDAAVFRKMITAEEMLEHLHVRPVKPPDVKEPGDTSNGFLSPAAVNYMIELTNSPLRDFRGRKLQGIFVVMTAKKLDNGDYEVLLKRSGRFYVKATVPASSLNEKHATVLQKGSELALEGEIADYKAQTAVMGHKEYLLRLDVEVPKMQFMKSSQGFSGLGNYEYRVMFIADSSAWSETFRPRATQAMAKRIARLDNICKFNMVLMRLQGLEGDGKIELTASSVENRRKALKQLETGAPVGGQHIGKMDLPGTVRDWNAAFDKPDRLIYLFLGESVLLRDLQAVRDALDKFKKQDPKVTYYVFVIFYGVHDPAMDKALRALAGGNVEFIDVNAKPEESPDTQPAQTRT